MWKKRHVIISSILIATILFFCSASAIRNFSVAEASKNKRETIDIRIIGTTDLHGQLNSKDYASGTDYNIGGLAKVAGLIEKSREGYAGENVFTFDAGDTLYDFTTEYISAEDQNAIQPIYKGMVEIGYDAITLGNHDFDYGYEYILRQLDETGLRNITVVSNVVDSKTDEHVFNEYMLFKRKMTTTSGKKVEVKVGVIGETIPTLTAKTHSYAGILKTEDIVENVKAKTQKLKELGADIIIVVAHTGMGPEKPEPNFKNVAYAITKIEDVDVVIGGHEHNLYPTTDMTSQYYKLPGVDKQTKLVNGKNFIMPGDRGRVIGLVDLKLEVNDYGIEIIDRKSEVKQVDEKANENLKISSKYGDWEELLLRQSKDVIGKVANNTIIHNNFGLLNDNMAIQLLNDSKRHYALRFANTEAGKAYKNYPIIAASAYYSYGDASTDNFVNISGDITESKLGPLQPYNNYLYVYTITGKQLKEWLEWSASAYETVAFDSKWSDITMSTLMKEHNLKSLLKEDWIGDHSNFFVFDGIDYEINPFSEARYDISGNKVSNGVRVKNITYNGEPVTDKTKMLICTNKITKPVTANKGIENQSVLGGFNRSQTVLSRYIKQEAKTGLIKPEVDSNWKVSFSRNNNFIVKIPQNAKQLFESSDYYVKKLSEQNGYIYYEARYNQSTVDKIAPKIIIAPVKFAPAASGFPVAISVTDSSKISSIKYQKGEYGVDDSRWSSISSLKNDISFMISENGTYTVRAEDIHGNATVKTIKIDNIDPNVLEAPTVVSYTNRKKSIQGTAEPNATVVVTASTGTYKGKIDRNGKYAVDMPGQPSGSEVTVYALDEVTGKRSEDTVVIVKRTGPNQPKISPINNNVGFISGSVNDSDATVIAIVDDIVYLAKGGAKKLYENATDIYNPSLKIVETTVDIVSSDLFSIKLPPQMAGETVTVYAIDHLSRVSRVSTAKVKEVAPNAPVVYEISNIEKSIGGYIPEAKGVYHIAVEINGNVYDTQTNKDGEFDLSFTEQLYAGQTIYVSSTNSNGKGQRSYKTPVKVLDIHKLISETDDLWLDELSVNSYTIGGSSDGSDKILLAIANGQGKKFKNEIYELYTDDFNEFSLELENKLEAGTMIYAMYRFSDGNIISVVSREVQGVKPVKPQLLYPVNNSNKEVKVITDKDSKVELTVGTKIYQSNQYIYDEATGKYIYTLNIDRTKSGKKVSVKASNKYGVSSILSSKVEKLAPDAPKLKRITSTSTAVEGTVDIIKNNVTGKKEIPTVYITIGKKTYKAKANNKGEFSIKVPKQKAGTEIKVWGENSLGRGPQAKFKVVK